MERVVKILSSVKHRYFPINLVSLKKDKWWRPYFPHVFLCEKMSSYCLNREIHPEGLPQSYTIIMLFRLLPESPNEPFAIWQITDRDYKPQVGVVLDRKDDYAYWSENLYITLFCMYSSKIFPKPYIIFYIVKDYIFSVIKVCFFFFSFSHQLILQQSNSANLHFNFVITSQTKRMCIYIVMG